MTPSQPCSSKQHETRLQEWEGKTNSWTDTGLFWWVVFTAMYTYRLLGTAELTTAYNTTLTKNNKTCFTKTRVLHKVLGRKSRTESSACNSQPVDCSWCKIWQMCLYIQHPTQVSIPVHLRKWNSTKTST